MNTVITSNNRLMSFLTDLHLLDQDGFYKLPSQSEMAEIDKLTIDSGVASLTLMERAGQSVLREIEGHCQISAEQKICILCGPGNNGGDGLVVARLLRKKGCQPLVISTCASKYSKDCLEQISQFIGCGGKVYSFPEEAEDPKFRSTVISRDTLQDSLSSADLIIDALLGTGQKNPPRGSILDLLNLLDNSFHRINKTASLISIDLPTGLNGDTGEVYQPHFKSDLSVCIELLKRGMCQYPGRNICGKIALVSINLDCRNNTEFTLLCQRTLDYQLYRKADSHKGLFGHVFVLGGSRNMPGAPLLAASAALRSGAGLVKAAVLKSSPLAVSTPELMYADFDDRDQGFFDHSLSSDILRLTGEQSALVLGPGLGTAKETGELVEELVKECLIPMVIDADALNLLAGSGKITKGSLELSGHVLTPHPGEMARLLKTDTMTVQKDRYAAARKLSELTKTVVILKGAGSIIYFQGRGFVNSSGNPFMATPGSGDVLAGVIGALLASGLDPLQAAKIGVFVHGLAGDSASRKNNGLIIASDIIDCLPHAFSSLSKESAL